MIKFSNSNTAAVNSGNSLLALGSVSSRFSLMIFVFTTVKDPVLLVVLSVAAFGVVEGADRDVSVFMTLDLASDVAGHNLFDAMDRNKVSTRTYSNGGGGSRTCCFSIRVESYCRVCICICSRIRGQTTFCRSDIHAGCCMNAVFDAIIVRCIHLAGSSVAVM